MQTSCWWFVISGSRKWLGFDLEMIETRQEVCWPTQGRFTGCVFGKLFRRTEKVPSMGSSKVLWNNNWFCIRVVIVQTNICAQHSIHQASSLVEGAAGNTEHSLTSMCSLLFLAALSHMKLWWSKIKGSAHRRVPSCDTKMTIAAPPVAGPEDRRDSN